MHTTKAQPYKSFASTHKGFQATFKCRAKGKKIVFKFVATFAIS